MKNWLKIALLSLLSFGQAWALSNYSLHPDVERILMQMSPPAGVVIEVESLSPEAMSDYTQVIQTQVDALKQRYADLDVVIVSHGRELVEFAKPESSAVPSDVLQAFETMTKVQGVTIHVCAVVAGWQGKSDQDFVDFVDVSASGEAQINDYKALGYDVIVIERLSDKERQQLNSEQQ